MFFWGKFLFRFLPSSEHEIPEWQWSKQNKSHFLGESVPCSLPSPQHMAQGRTEAAAPPANRYHGNPIWAYQVLKPKDILDNNTIAAQPGYLRELDLWGEIWEGGRLQIERINPPFSTSTEQNSHDFHSSPKTESDAWIILL